MNPTASAPFIYTLIGVNYKKADAYKRGLFALNNEACERIIAREHLFPVRDVVIISTCNRSEIYGFCARPEALVELISEEIEGETSGFLACSYTKSGGDAMRHLFEVTAGLDAQILGDYEIVGQVKKAWMLSREIRPLSAITERIFTTALQASKDVRANTQITSGAVSVSFAAVRHIMHSIDNYLNKHILLAGLGDIGGNTLKHLCSYAQHKNITLINRNYERCRWLSEHTGLPHARWEDFSKVSEHADIIIIATSAETPWLHKDLLPQDGRARLLIDLAIPRNINPNVSELPHVQLVDVDALTRAVDDTLQKRQAELPKAQAIIDEIFDELNTWLQERKQMGYLKKIKNDLLAFQELGISEPTVAATDVQAHLNELARNFRKQTLIGCSVIQTYQNFLDGTARKK